MMRVPCLLLLAAMCAAGQNAPEVSASDEPASFKSRVNLVTVPVVVRDARGHAVGTLGRDDFQLFDKGRPQAITRFSVERRDGSQAATASSNTPPGAAETAPAVDVPQQYIAYLFDDVHLAFTDLVRTRDAANRNILASTGPGTRIAIFTTSGIGNLDFTDDLPALQAALMKLRPHPIARSSGQECPDISFYMADLIVNRNDTQAFQVAVDETIACMNLTGPAQSAAPQIARSAAQRAMSGGEQESHVALTVLNEAVRRISAMPGQRVIVLTSPGFLVLTDLRFEESDVLERAIHANVIINALDARGLYTDSVGGDVSKRQYSDYGTTVKTHYDISASRENADVMAELAAGTGGTFYENSNDADLGYRRLAAAPEFVYVLGFAPQNLKMDGSFHQLKVRLTNPSKLQLQARRGYYAPRHAADPAETAKQEIAEALYSQEQIHDLPVDLHTQFFKSSDTGAKLAVLTHLDLKHLQFRKADGRNNCELTIVAVLFDRNGNFVKGLQKDLKLRLKDETLASHLGPGLTVKTSFDVTPGNYMVRLVVRDAEAQQMAAETGAVEIP